MTNYDNYTITNTPRKSCLSSVNVFSYCVISNASQGCKTYGWSKQERQEIWRRRLSFLMYLLRSPFYDRVTKWCIVFAFTSAQNMNIPFSSIAFEALMAYIPHYRRLYYYLWSKQSKIHYHVNISVQHFWRNSLVNQSIFSAYSNNKSTRIMGEHEYIHIEFMLGQ